MTTCVGINAGIAETVLREGTHDLYRAYIGFKVAAKGGSYFHRNGSTLSKVQCLCNWSRQTAKKRLETLIKKGWLGEDNEGRVYVRGQNQLRSRLDVETTLRHVAAAEYVISDKDFFRSVLFSVVVGVSVGQRRHSLVRNATHISGAARRSSYTPGRGEKYTPNSLSLSFLAGKLAKAKSTIHRWKHKAMDQGLLQRTKNEHVFDTSDVKALKQALPDQAHRLHLSFKEGGRARIRLTDELSTSLQFKTA